MIIVLNNDAKKQQIDELRSRMQGMGFVVIDIFGESTNMLGLAGDTSSLTQDMFTRLDYVINH